MNALDIILLLCFIPSVIRGLSKGFLEQAVSFAGVILSVWLAFKFTSLVCTWIQPYINVEGTVLSVIAFALILIAVSLGALVLGKALSKILEMAMLGWLDKGLGLVFAIAVTAMILGVGVTLFDSINSTYMIVSPEKLEESVMYGGLRDFSALVFPYLKQLLIPGPNVTAA